MPLTSQSFAKFICFFVGEDTFFFFFPSLLGVSQWRTPLNKGERESQLLRNCRELLNHEAASNCQAS